MTGITILRSETFAAWIDNLRDRQAVAQIEVRIARMQQGNPGDVRPVGRGVCELRIKHGPGYRVYFVRRGHVMVILLCGGDKSSQVRDIQKAYALAEEW